MRNDRRGGGGYGGGGNGGGRGGRGGGRHGGGGRGGFRRGGRGRGPMRGTAVSGNQRERIAIESGFLVFIDQFMLANPQFIERLKVTEDKDPTEKDSIIREFGGNVVQVEPGLYRIERDPFTTSIMIHRDGEQFSAENINKEEATKSGEVYIDTRCVAMIDRELLDDSSLLEKYQQLWFSGEDKACRDLLRDNGGAVRYGFNRNGDNLGIYEAADNTVCIWPL